MPSTCSWSGPRVRVEGVEEGDQALDRRSESAAALRGHLISFEQSDRWPVRARTDAGQSCAYAHEGNCRA